MVERTERGRVVPFVVVERIRVSDEMDALVLEAEVGANKPLLLLLLVSGVGYGCRRTESADYNERSLGSHDSFGGVFSAPCITIIADDEVYVYGPHVLY